MLKTDPQQTEFIDFCLPFGGKLSTNNRWIKLARIVPWNEVEQCYAESLAGTGMGSPAKSGRIAFGSLIIKERLAITDEETVQQIVENPYLQYFLGLHEYREEPLFDPSMMVHFRSRFGEEHHQRINSRIIELATQEDDSEVEDDDSADEAGTSPTKAGKLLVDATCTPADITYPTDLKLLGEAREKTELYIDRLHAADIGKKKKPRNYRRKARRQYLAVAKQKKPSTRKSAKPLVNSCATSNVTSAISTEC